MTFNSANSKEASVKEAATVAALHVLSNDEAVNDIINRCNESQQVNNSYKVH
jgi:hypothetical protein